jgi:SNF2 family DNA or RNA helicase
MGDWPEPMPLPWAVHDLEKIIWAESDDFTHGHMTPDGKWIVKIGRGRGKTLMKPYPYQEQAITKMPKILVVCPNSAKDVWRSHAEQAMTGWPVVVVKETTAKARARKIEAFKWGMLIINWDAIRVADVWLPLYTHQWDYIIADEAHFAKNRNAQRTKALKKLRTTHKRAVSGTPLVNRPDEFWSLLHWLFPKEFRSYWRFYEEYCDYEIHPVLGYKMFKGPKNLDKLRDKIKPFTIRRLKQDVLKDLPDKYYTYIPLDMPAPQARAYKEMHKKSLAWVGEHEDEPVKAPMVIAQLTRLRQFADAYAELTNPHTTDVFRRPVRLSEPSNKQQALLELVASTDQPIVVFSQFRQMIRLAEQAVATLGERYIVMAGDTPDGERPGLIRDFQEKRVRIFMATTQTGGVGITLTAASTAIFLDRSWSPAVNLQAEDRLHRIGQKNAVQVIILQSKGTVDETVEERLEMKWSYIRKILGDTP